MADVSQWKLRRIAPRVLRVLERRAPAHPPLAAHGATIGPQAQAFIAAYDALSNYAPTWKKEFGEGRTGIAELLQVLRGWLPLASRDIPNFAAGEFGDRPDVPDDVLADAERFIDAVGDARGPAGEALGWVETALQQIQPLFERANREWHEAEAADQHYQALGRQCRAAAAALVSELVLFRRTVLATLGRSDRDYQRLRLAKAAAPEADDDTARELPAVPV